jgi:hypothetical protein
MAIGVTHVTPELSDTEILPRVVPLIYVHNSNETDMKNIPVLMTCVVNVMNEQVNTI